MFFSKKLLRYTLGGLWLIDAIFQVQPQMFTTNMINSVLLPTLSSQPAPIAASLHMIIDMITQHLVFFNLLIAIVQAEIGLFLIAGVWLRATTIISIVWALIVWYGGEGMNMLLTGQASILTGAPGAVLLYPLLGLLIYPRKTSSSPNEENSLLSREQFRWVFAGFWIFAGLLQLQPIWWQRGQIAQTIGDMTNLGGLNSTLVDPILSPVAKLTAQLEVPLNIALVVIFLGLGVGLALAKPRLIRPLLIVSIVLSVIIWWIAQGFGMIFTGMATDFNSGLLLVVMALECWPKPAPRSAVQSQLTPDMAQPEGAVQIVGPAVS